MAAFSGACVLSAHPPDIKFDRFEQWPGYPRAAVRSIGQDAEGFLWLATPGGSLRFDGNVFDLFPKQTFSSAAANQSISRQLTGRSGAVWTGEGAVLRCDRPGGAPAQRYRLPAGAGACRAVFLHPALSGDSVLWVLADSTLLCFHVEKNRFIRDYRNRSHDAQSLHGAPFRCAFFSREGILWLGGEGGLCKYDWRNQQFRLYQLNPGPANKGGELNFVQGLAGDTSRCWVTTNDMGLLQYDLNEHRLLPDQIRGELQQLGGRNAYSMAYDRLGRLWVGNCNDSIFVCDAQKGKIVRRIPLNGDLIHFIFKDVLLGHFWRLHKPSGATPAIIRIHQETLRRDTFRVPYWQNQQFANRIDYFAPTRNDTSWFVHNAAFIQFYHAASSTYGQKPIAAFSGIRPDMSKYYNLRYDAVRDALWLMAVDTIYELDWKNQTASAYATPRRQPGQTNIRIHTDDAGRVWLQCIPENVLYKFDPERKTFARYDWSDGLPAASVECVDMGRVGKKWCQRYHDYSFLLFDPAQIPVFPVGQSIVTGIRPLNQKGVLIPAAGGVLRTAANDLRISFTAVAFEQGRHLQFQYRLLGVDTAWVPSGPDRAAIYENLSPGDYRFQVMAANREGAWNPVPAEISFTVQLPLHQQTRFWLGLSLLLTGLLYAGMRFFEKRRIARYQLRQRIAEDLQNEVELALNDIRALSADSQLHHHTRRRKRWIISAISSGPCAARRFPAKRCCSG
ncbi:MAG: hypothetical protein IPM81_20675 [Saprospirales bacterium]|nr:hypothetical protein [Saprospirales bacterium]